MNKKLNIDLRITLTVELNKFFLLSLEKPSNISIHYFDEFFEIERFINENLDILIWEIIWEMYPNKNNNKI